MADGVYPRLNAALVQSGEFNNCPLASLVGTIQQADMNTMMAHVKCCDGGVVQIKLDPDYAAQMMGPNQAVEIMGTIDETGMFQMYIYRDFGTDFDMALYNDMIMKVQRDSRYFDYFGVTPINDARFQTPQ